MRNVTPIRIVQTGVILALVFVCVFLSRNIPYVFGQTSNLLSNGGFESGNLTGWTGGNNVTVTQSNLHEGTYAVRSTGGGLNRTLQTAVGKRYKMTVWVYIASMPSDGSVSMDFTETAVGAGKPWYSLASDNAMQNSLPRNAWSKVAFTFTSIGTNSVRYSASASGTGVEVFFDDFRLFEVSGANISPSVSIQANTTNSTSVPATISFTSTTDDPDGGFASYYWDFGDGSRAEGANITHNYLMNGTYTSTLTVTDDDGASAQASKTITISDPSYPSIVVNPVNSPSSNPTFSMAGTAQSGSAITKVEYSTDRGLTGTASGTNNWSFNLNLTGYSGRNRVLINAFDANGRNAKSDVLIYYRPTNKISIVSGSNGVSQNNSSIEQYDKFEATFSLQDFQYSNPYVPYETNLPLGMSAVKGEGITVEGIFTSPSGQVYRQPGFLYQPFVNSVPTGDPVWKIRFSPIEKGNWTYQIGLTDASGSTTLTDNTKLKFTAVQPTNPNNHGFLHVSQKDPRYFEFSDGTPYIGVGPAPDTGSSLAQNLGTSNLRRTWMSGSNIAGSSWAPWTAGINYEGNYPGTSLTTDEAYGDGIFSFQLPQTNGSGSRCAFYGFQGSNHPIKANTNYKVSVRLKSVDVKGSGGFIFRIVGTDWPSSCDAFSTRTKIFPYVTGTKDWHVVSGIWNSGSLTRIGYGLITLENVTGGTVYVDEISIREDLGNGKLGPEILSRSKFNTHEYFSQIPSLEWDNRFDTYTQNGVYEKPVIEEKGDYVFNHIAPSGYGFKNGEQMSKTGGTRKYQEYYWRYLTARYGYSRAVHSWEFANEQSPGAMTEAHALGTYIKLIDPIKHMATTSFWCCISDGIKGFYWQNTGPGKTYSGVDYADTHSYVLAPPDNSSWLRDSSYPLTVNGITASSYASLGNDSALYVYFHSMDSFNRNGSGNRPIIMGEAGIGDGTTIAGNSDSDTKGIWLHQFIWAQVNPGAMYFIYWFDSKIRSNNLWYLFGHYRKFMEGQSGDTVNKRVPLTNGEYKDIQLTLPTGVNGWGQKDVTNGGAHFWAYDSSYTWKNTGGGASLANKQFSFSGLPTKQYTVEFWNTWTGTVTTQNVSHSGGTLTVTVPSNWTEKDVAVKIIPTTGYPSIVAPTANPTQPPKPGDANGDGKVDGVDYITWLNHYNQTISGVSNGDFNTDGKVDGIDYITWLTNYGS